MKNIGFDKVSISGGLWLHMQKLNKEVTMQSVYSRFKDTGRFRALECVWNEGEPDKPHIFWDSDVAKWLEAAAYILRKEKGRRKSSALTEFLEKTIEESVDALEKNAWDDGYINSYYTRIEPQNRFTKRNNHELYCCGHLIEAACAYYDATGKDRFLKLMCRYADLVDKVFREEKSAAFSTPGHEEIELALFRLAETTGNEKYKNLAEFFLEARGNSPKDNPAFTDSPQEISEERVPRYYAQDYPIRMQKKAIGHSVRALYLASAMADYALESGDEELKNTCRELFSDITEKKMYVTGGLGSAAAGECFTLPYDLPNSRAYSETCAAIAMIFFCARLLKLEWRSEYADTVERILYNAFLSGISLDGRSFFYENPLEIDLENNKRPSSGNRSEYFPITQRVEVFSCSCCPPNVNRLLASIGNYIYSTDGEKLAVQQYIPSEGTDGDMKFSVSTEYPKNGVIAVKTGNVAELWLRIPGWCRSFTLTQPYTLINGYAVVRNPEPEVILELDMPVRAVYSRPEVRGNAGRLGIMRGPVVYCAESKDNGGKLLNSLLVSCNASAAIMRKEYNGIPCISVKGFETVGSGTLYTDILPAEKECKITFIPYFAFANRGPDNMQVWLRYHNLIEK